MEILLSKRFGVSMFVEEYVDTVVVTTREAILHDEWAVGDVDSGAEGY